MGQQAPSPACPHKVEDGMKNRAQAMLTRSAACCRWWEEGLDQLPFGVREVGEVADRGKGNHATQRIPDGRAADFSDGF